MEFCFQMQLNAVQRYADHFVFLIYFLFVIFTGVFCSFSAFPFFHWLFPKAILGNEQKEVQKCKVRPTFVAAAVSGAWGVPHSSVCPTQTACPTQPSCTLRTLDEVLLSGQKIPGSEFIDQ